MGMKNCPNCGAIVDLSHNKCPYCGTSYYDLSCLPMDEPFFLRIDTFPYAKEAVIVKAVVHDLTMRSYPDELPEIELTLTCLPYEGPAGKEINICKKVYEN